LFNHKLKESRYFQMTPGKEYPTTPSTNPSSSEISNQEYVPRRFGQRAAATPGAVALVSNTLTLTFAELDRRANRLSHHLRSLGVGPNVLVGLFVDRSVEFVVGALSILKAGGAFVPLDPSVPTERLRSMFHDAQPPVVVAHSRTQAMLPSCSGKLVLVDDAPASFAGYALEPVETTLEEGDIAYVVYTSGSTGQPNGVEITHGGLRNLVNWHQHAFEITAFDRASHQAPIGFDAAVWEIWPYLTAGATVYLAPDQITSHPERFRDWLLTQKIRIAFAAAALAERMLLLPWPEDTPLRILLTGADVLHLHPSAKLPFKLVNNYGPTECTVVTTSGLVPASEQQAVLPTIGWPIDNARVYIVDDVMCEVRAGEAGEICIGGAGLARGYLNRPQLTATRFVPNPFRDGKEARLYRTGDLGRYLPDGQITFLGRLDEQVKIRGCRVELEEIVCHLDAHPAVQVSAVICQEDKPGDKQLIAYFVLAPGTRPEEIRLREFLSMRLPEYMIPTAFVRVEALPLTEHGKIDRAKLPAPDGLNLLRDACFVAASTPIEERLVTILAPLLRVGSISLNDNFFFLGGHSLLGAQVVSRINQTFKVEMTLLSLFEHPTVAEIASEIERLILAKIAVSSSSEAQGSVSLLESGHTA
jgi:amino acid adenylation domain-containing protein